MSSIDKTFAFLLVITLIGIACTYWSDYKHRRQQHRHP